MECRGAAKALQTGALAAGALAWTDNMAEGLWKAWSGKDGICRVVSVRSVQRRPHRWCYALSAVAVAVSDCRDPRLAEGMAGAERYTIAQV